MTVEFITSPDGRSRVTMNRDEYDMLVSARRYANARVDAPPMARGSQANIDQWHAHADARAHKSAVGSDANRPTSTLHNGALLTSKNAAP